MSLLLAWGLFYTAVVFLVLTLSRQLHAGYAPYLYKNDLIRTCLTFCRKLRTTEKNTGWTTLLEVRTGLAGFNLKKTNKQLLISLELIEKKFKESSIFVLFLLYLLFLIFTKTNNLKKIDIYLLFDSNTIRLKCYFFLTYVNDLSRPSFLTFYEINSASC